jgi:chromosome segregation ATPase
LLLQASHITRKQKIIILEKKHINWKKPYVPDGISDFKINVKPDDNEWSRFEPAVGEKILSEEIFAVPERAITFDRNKIIKTKEDSYKEKAENVKDNFVNTAQYLKFINAHLTEKKNYLDKMLTEKNKFEDIITSLNPNQITKEQLDEKNYNNVKAEDVRKVLQHVERERDLIKERLEHFSSQINVANEALINKNKEIDEIKTELSIVEISESKLPKNEKEITISEMQQQANTLESKTESEKIFGAINSLVVLLNSKNQATLNELKSVKSEFTKMKQEYDKVMRMLEQKKK